MRNSRTVAWFSCIIAQLPASAREAYQHAVASGTHGAFLLGSAVAVLALAAAVFVTEVR
ncbi:hypothetical protein V5O46_12010 [Streptomyces sp. C6-003]